MGAKGLKGSLNFILVFNVSTIFFIVGFAIIDLAPSALGPNSDLLLKTATTLFSWILFAIYFAISVQLIFSK